MMTTYKKLFLRLGHCWTLLFSLFLWVSIVGLVPSISAEPSRISLAQSTSADMVLILEHGTSTALLEQ